MEINYEHLKMMYNHVLLNVPEENFDLSCYKKDLYFFTKDIKKEHICGSIGCIIGHCISLDLDNVNENFKKYEFTNENYEDVYEIEYSRWSVYYTGVYGIDKLWFFLFGADWADNLCTKEHSLARMKMLIDTQDEDLCVNLYKEYDEEIDVLVALYPDQKIDDKITSYHVDEKFYDLTPYVL